MKLNYLSPEQNEHKSQRSTLDKPSMFENLTRCPSIFGKILLPRYCNAQDTPSGGMLACTPNGSLAPVSQHEETMSTPRARSLLGVMLKTQDLELLQD